MRVVLIGMGVAVATTVALSAALPTLKLQLPSPDSGAPKLFKDSRQAIAIARAQGRRDVTLVIATVAGRSDAAARDAARLGGDVRHHDDEVGYLRVRIPIDRATELAESANVEAAAADIDDTYPMRSTAAEQVPSPPLSADAGMLQAQAGEPWPPRRSDYPLRHQYSPIKDLGAAEVLAKNPTYDGRGVTIAVLDGNLDLLLPEFQTAYTLEGAQVPKIADYLNVTDPRDDAELNPQWVDMRAQVTAANARVTYAGKTFTVPRAGKYRIGLFDERRFNYPSNAAYIEQDVDRNGNPKGDNGLYGVLWDEGTNHVWVDTNRDASFADEQMMTDYIKRQDVGVFGNDDPKTPIRESIGFAVQTDPANQFVSINLAVYQHATIIMGSVVGNREPNGRINGVAPGARIVSMFYGVGIMHSAIEGMIRAFRHPLVDLIVFEQSVAMASIPYLLADGRHPISIIAQRLIERYDKLLFVPGSNSPGLGIVAEDGLARDAISVGGYQSRDSYLINWGLHVAEQDNLHWGALSHGPSGTGALKPDLLAPSGQLSTDPGYRKGGTIKGLYQLPSGYAVDGGTSTATPMAAGATALVVSAAKQRGFRYDAARLKAALTGSTRYIARLGAHEQGAGLIQVGAAIELLEKLQSEPIITIESRAPVRTALSGLLATPHEGVGLYEREGWQAGERGERIVTLTRKSGPAEPMTFALRWLGNDGTFSSAASLVLPLNQPVALPVSISVKDAGAHSATLVLEHPTMSSPAQRVLCTIIAALPLSADNKYTVSTTVELPKPSDRGVFVAVPAGTRALSFAGLSATGPLRMTLISPDRQQYYACMFTPGTFAPTAAPCALADPAAGVWEINLAHNDAMTFDETATEPMKPKQVTVTASALGVEVDATPPANSLAAGASETFPLRLVNRLGTVTAAAAGTGAIGSALRASRTITRGEQHVYEIVVPKGANSLRVKMNADDARADLDIYLLDCTAADLKAAAPPYQREDGGRAPPVPPPSCTPKAKSAGVEPSGEIEVADPAPGRWVAVVDAFSVAGAAVKYDYFDVFTHPRFGAIAISDAADDRTAGATWSPTAHTWTASQPEPPRTLHGRVTITSRNVTQAIMAADFSQRPWPVPLGSLEWFGANQVASER